MEAPLILSTNMSHGAEMTLTVLVGAGFGFALERAGFGTAKNLTSIFYGRDFRVMRVMFSAILTAMVGVYFLDLAGIMPLGNIGLLPTYLWPQLVGGLLLGAGFIIGGYCPGTSIVATMSGKLDAVVFILGVIVGSGAFTIAYDAFASFHQTGKMGRVLLHEYFGLSSAVMVFAVAVVAVGMLYTATRIERIVNARLGGDDAKGGAA
ncbi:MAG: hypothetical protein CSB49_08610 [Proteobacteria bacterium]|nr:MAG: hypothetical protein CSB49_08610 [Pseudomonadota bacterium]